eukprot:440798-Hanusia_phi.AAC.4
MVKDGVVAAFVRVLLLLPPLACASTLSRNRPTLSTYPFLSDPARFQNLLQAKSLSWKSDDLALVSSDFTCTLSPDLRVSKEQVFGGAGQELDGRSSVRCVGLQAEDDEASGTRSSDQSRKQNRVAV